VKCHVRQLTSAVLVAVFAAAMLIAGQSFVEYRSTKHPSMIATTPGRL
jgi:hypothetical protein